LVVAIYENKEDVVKRKMIKEKIIVRIENALRIFRYKFRIFIIGIQKSDLHFVSCLKSQFYQNLPPDIISFPSQQNNELFLAGQNTMKRHDFINKNNYNLFLPFKILKCLSLFDSDTDSLDEIQASLSAIAGLGSNSK